MIDRTNVIDSIFHLMVLESIDYIVKKPLLDYKQKLLQVEELGDHLGERIANHLLNNKDSSSQGGAIISSTKMDVDDIMKFLGRDVWSYLFNKQIAKLQTNRKGTFLIDCEEIKFHSCLITEKGNVSEDKLEIILGFISGIIKGVLSAFNYESSVFGNFKPQIVVNNFLNPHEKYTSGSNAQLPYSFTINLLNYN